MRCARCGNGTHDRGAAACKVCGTPLPEGAGRATASSSSHYRDPSKWERHLLARVGDEALDLKSGEEFVIGRSSDCDLTISSNRISRMHAQIFWQQGRAVIRDLGSENGTLVNGNRVVEHMLRDGDEINVGPYLLTYRRMKAVGSVQEAQEMLDSEADTQAMQAVSMSGKLQDVSLYEILETLQYNSRTGTVQIYSAWGAEGAIGLADGRPVYAYQEEKRGREAVLALLEWTDGLFSFSTELVRKPANLRADLGQILAEFRSRRPGQSDYRDADQGSGR